MVEIPADKPSEIKAETLAYTHLHICIAHTAAHVFGSVGQKCYRYTDTLLDVERKTLGNTLADKITHAPFYAVADMLAEVEAEKLGNNTGRCES